MCCVFVGPVRNRREEIVLHVVELVGYTVGTVLYTSFVYVSLKSQVSLDLVILAR